ncbi:YfmQ [Bacillus subtilis]|nr:YfmQ [Bacillus subtilis]
MTWAIVMLILMSLVKIVLTCLPTGVIEWLLGKFEVHAKLSDENASLSLDGKRLEGAEKQKVIDQFNEAIFLEKYYIYPGDERALFTSGKRRHASGDRYKKRKKRREAVRVPLRRPYRRRETVQEESDRVSSAF